MKESYQAVWAWYQEKLAKDYANERDFDYELRELTKMFITEYIYQKGGIKKYEAGNDDVKRAMISQAAGPVLSFAANIRGELEDEYNTPPEKGDLNTDPMVGFMRIYEWLIDAKTDGVLPSEG